MIKRRNGREVSPSIVSKAKHALGLKKTVPLNDKLCSRELWNEVVEVIGEVMQCPNDVIEQAKQQYSYYMEPYFV